SKGGRIKELALFWLEKDSAKKAYAMSGNFCRIGVGRYGNHFLQGLGLAQSNIMVDGLGNVFARKIQFAQKPRQFGAAWHYARQSLLSFLGQVGARGAGSPIAEE